MKFNSFNENVLSKVNVNKLNVCKYTSKNISNKKLLHNIGTFTVVLQYERSDDN